MKRRPNTIRSHYRPWIEVSVAQSSNPAGFGSVAAVLHYNAREVVALAEHQIRGPACIHVAGEADPADLKALDQIVVKAKTIGAVLGVPVRLDRDALADIVWAPTAQGA